MPKSSKYAKTNSCPGNMAIKQLWISYCRFYFSSGFII